MILLEKLITVWLLIGKLEKDNTSLYVWDIGKPP